MKGKAIIGSSLLIWAIILCATIFINNSYINAIALMLGLLITLCGCTLGCEMIEKNDNASTM